MPNIEPTLARERLAEKVSAASYGTILVLAALAVIDADNVDDGLGWELVTGIGLATWVAHLYAEIVGDRLRHGTVLNRHELGAAMADGLPILLASVLPAIMLLLGRLEVLAPSTALWASVVVAITQLVGVGAFVASSRATRGSSSSLYAAVTAAVGLLVVALKLTLGH